MSQELLYTSAPRGLVPGAKGFCTIAATRGMSPLVMERLERLSSYREVFPPHDPLAERNPIQYSHLRFSADGKEYSVLSRIGAAELDYSQRTNFFAHHVLLESQEWPAGGPAWLLQSPGYMKASWNSPVGYLAPRATPVGDTEAAICREWQSVTGDAGWAGVVADALIEKRYRQVYLVYEPGLDLLPLFTELLGLLPPRQRWSVSFSTYYASQGLPQGYSCPLRGVLAQSPEHHAASRMPGTLVIPLHQQLKPTVGGTLVEQARTGTRPIAIPVAKPAPVQAASPPQPLKKADQLGFDLDELPWDSLEQAPSATDEFSLVLADPIPMPRAASGPPPVRVRHLKPDKRGSARAWLLVASVPTICLFIAIALFSDILSSKDTPDPITVAVVPPRPEPKPSLPKEVPSESTRGNSPNTPPAPRGNSETGKNGSSQSEASSHTVASPDPGRPTGSALPPQLPGNEGTKAVPQPPGNEGTKSVPQPKPEAPRADDWLDLPPQDGKATEEPIKNSAKDPVSDPLSLVGDRSFRFERGGKAVAEEAELTLKEREGKEFVIQYLVKSNDPDLRDLGTPVPIASLRCENGKVHFRWLRIETWQSDKQICTKAEERLRCLVLRCGPEQNAKYLALRAPRIIEDRATLEGAIPVDEIKIIGETPFTPTRPFPFSWNRTHPAPFGEVFLDKGCMVIGNKTIVLDTQASGLEASKNFREESEQDAGMGLFIKFCKLELCPRNKPDRLSMSLVFGPKKLSEPNTQPRPASSVEAHQEARFKIESLEIYTSVDEIRVPLYKFELKRR